MISACPPKTAYACLAETALLGMEGRFEAYTLGRNISMERVKEIYRLFKKHQFPIAGLRSFGQYVTGEMVTEKRALAEALRQDAAELAAVQQTAAARLAEMPVMAKGVQAPSRRPGRALAGLAAGLGLIGVAAGWRRRRVNGRA